ncbi:MAG: phosphotransferase [Planctomycetes bacterium]|jgi:hypothetical protein|nr:phosphotransferase [Planctomycetota bacterium]
MRLTRVITQMFRQATAIGPLTPGRARVLSDRERQRLMRVVQAQHKSETNRRSHGRAGQIAEAQSVGGTPGGLVDALFTTAAEPKLPDEVFPLLRWGGIVAYLGGSEERTRTLAAQYTPDRGFIIERPVTAVHANTMGLRLPGLTPKGYTFTARKTRLIQAGDVTDRFTYHVELTPEPNAEHGYVVTKSIPTYDDILHRLRVKFPHIPDADLQKRAKKLVVNVFPTFLSREAAILKILQRYLPEQHRRQVPRLLNSWTGKDGLVRKLSMNWLRVGGEPLSHLQFARQSAELLRSLHEDAGVIHLDLRLDNFVITPGGVGFVDFGSAVRVGETFASSPMLYSLFAEMMRTSHIQRMLGRMLETGHVTNQAMREVHGKVDKTVDAFYLAVQIQKPHGNPELAPLIDYQPETPVALALSNLTAAILRPKNPAKAHFKTAADILRAIDRIERRLEAGDDPPKRKRVPAAAV